MIMEPRAAQKKESIMRLLPEEIYNRILEEEKQADATLTEVAISTVNPAAASEE